ncbi:hypothetical protein [Streptomyces mirabilis]|uniref:hypothetical protein n=1 Tax=Streptomyces mirabilis TaxID=68239 RepID=UPI0033259227
MDEPAEVDQDAVLRARTMLLGSGRLPLHQQIEAYRVLSGVSPATYLPKLSRALHQQGYASGLRDLPEARLALRAEAVATARKIDAGHPKRTELLLDTLGGYRRELYDVGRRAEGFAVCEEMAEAGRWGFEHGQVASPARGQLPLIVALAEEGLHGEAAELCGRVVRAQSAGDADGVSFWFLMQWAAELQAAGRHDEALGVFTDGVHDGRARLEVDRIPLAELTWRLTHQAGMLEAAGRHAEVDRAREEALALLAELAETGERKAWSDIVSWWCTLFAWSGRSAEPAACSGAPAPAFGMDVDHWSPDVRRTYFDGLPRLEKQVADLGEAAAADQGGGLPDLVLLHRRLIIRATLYRKRHACDFHGPLRPLFDEQVALTRRLVATGQDQVPLRQALTDRCLFLIAAKRYGEAYDDGAEAFAVPD